MEMASQICDMARMQVKKMSPNLVHPLLCLDAIQFGIERGSLAGLAKVCESNLPAASALFIMNPSASCIDCNGI